MKTKQVIWTFALALLCGLLIFTCQYTLKDCLWWECVPERDFHVLDLELPVFLFPDKTYLSPISPSSEGGGEIERGSQSIFWDDGDRVAIYSIYRYPTIKRAIRAFKFYIDYMVDSETKKPWIHPNEVIFSSPTADEMIIACGNWSERRCGMLARYQEYVIFFNATMDEKMTYTEFEKIATYLDEQISSRLYP